MSGRASHAVYRHRGWRCALVGSGGAPVGLINHLSWADVSFSLAPGERLCLFSDGITECENRSGEQFGEVRLQAWLQDSVTQPLPALLRGLPGT